MPATSASGAGLKAATRETVFAMWAAELGLSLPELLLPNRGVWISPNRELDEIIVVRLGADIRIAAPAFRIAELSEVIGALPPSNYCDPGFWQEHFPGLIASMSVPSMIYYLDTLPGECKGRFEIPKGVRIRGLAASDMKICAEFAAKLTREEREATGLDAIARHAWGVFRDGALASVVSYEAWPGRIAHLGIATAPEFRRLGLAELALSTAIRGIFQRRRIAQFRCDSADIAGNSLARALGFLPVVETFSIRPPAAH
ncbi:MAG: hypothetical protein RL088_1863 [Verrucomicrobiota bacterium]